MTAPWSEALVFAISGERQPLGGSERPDVAEVLALPRLRSSDAKDVVARRREAGEPWPFPLPEDLRRALPSMAQFYAALERVVDGLDVHPHPARAQRAPDADERRLLADRPPHWGRVS